MEILDAERLNEATDRTPERAQDCTERDTAAAIADAKRMLAERLERGETLSMPHCLAAYSHLAVNADGTTRSCCSVQSSLATLYESSFDEVWNSEPYQELRRQHAGLSAPRTQCVACTDPMRFYHLVQFLEILDSDGVELTRIRKPDDFPLPSSFADHPLVRKLGTAVV